MICVYTARKDTLRSFVSATLELCGIPADRNVVNQIVGTAAVESDLGKYCTQLGGGPALGIFQMEPRTRKDIMKSYLAYRSDLKNQIENGIGQVIVTDVQFEASLTHQVIYCYLHYRRFNAWGTNLDEYADNWKVYYNTKLGKGTRLDFKEKYRRYLQ